MGRLIDADKFKERCTSRHERTAKGFRSDREIGLSGLVTDFLCADIDAQETVEAIPIDWLMQKIDEWKSDGRYACDFSARLLTALINDWRKKNGT